MVLQQPALIAVDDALDTEGCLRQARAPCSTARVPLEHPFEYPLEYRQSTPGVTPDTGNVPPEYTRSIPRYR